MPTVLPSVLLIDDGSPLRYVVASTCKSLNITPRIHEPTETLLSESQLPTCGCIIGMMRLLDVRRLLMLSAHHGATLPIICVADSPSVQSVVRVTRDGAFTVLELPVKKTRLAELFTTVFEISSRNHEQAIRIRDLRRRVKQLTPREEEILGFVKIGMTSREIAIELGRSVKTVERHHACVLRKLNCRNTIELVREVTQIEDSLD